MQAGLEIRNGFLCGLQYRYFVAGFLLKLLDQIRQEVKRRYSLSRIRPNAFHHFHLLSPPSVAGRRGGPAHF